MKGASFVVDAFEDVIDVVLHCSHSMEPFFCRGAGEFLFVLEVYGVEITLIETSV